MGQDYSNWQIIVVEDTYDDARVISRVLEHYGVTVHLAGNGSECMTLLNGFHPTAIITDLSMPQMDGWATLSAVREARERDHIPVIAITAYHSAEVADEALRHSFDGYFAKPLDPLTFMAQLDQIVRAS